MNNRSVSIIGMITGSLVIILTVSFSIFFSMYMNFIPKEWTGIVNYCNNFDEKLYIAWVVPCLLLALIYPIFIYTVYCNCTREKKVISGIGLVYAVMYGAILSANYFILLNVVRGSINSGYVNGLDWLVIGSPNSITFALEGMGYGFMGLSMFFVGLSFSNNRLIKWIYTINGLVGVLSVIGVILGFMVASIISLVLWIVTFPIAVCLTVFYFRKSYKSYENICFDKKEERNNSV